MAVSELFGFSRPKEESLDDILAVFTETEARLDTFQAQQMDAAATERAELEALQARLNARLDSVDRAARVKAKVQAITA